MASPSVQTKSPPTEQYVLITAARNEKPYIAKTVEAVLTQSLPPSKWVVVSDGSTDGTDAMVERLTTGCQFVDLVRLDSPPGRDLRRKARAINMAYERVCGAEAAYVGIVDADGFFAQDYFERLSAKFLDAADLGLAGGVVFEEQRGEYSLV